MSRTVAIYARISLDRKGESESPERQVAACRQLIDGKGWAVGQVFIDRDASAFKQAPRSQLEKLWNGLEADEFSAVCVWRLDRLTRRFTDTGPILKRLQDAGAELLSVTDNLDTSTPTGKAIIGFIVAQAETESRNTSLRVATAWEARAAQGKPHVGGRRCFGYDKDMRQIPEEAKAARKVVRQLLAGKSLHSIATELNANNIKTSAGNAWTHASVRQWASAPGLAGIRTHRGVELQGNWKPIITKEQREQLLIRLGDARPANGGTTVRKWLLTGLARCSCGGRMSVSHGRNYGCEKGCMKVYASLRAVDQFVIDNLFDYLSRGGIEPLTEMQDPSVLRQSTQEDERRLESLNRARFVDADISKGEWQPAKDALVRRIDTTSKSLNALEADQRSELRPGNREDLEAWWSTATIDQKRAAVRGVFTSIVIRPTSRRGCKFDTDRIDLNGHSFSGASMRIAKKTWSGGATLDENDPDQQQGVDIA